MTSVELSACKDAPNCLEAGLLSDEGNLSGNVVRKANRGVIEQNGPVCAELFVCLGDACTAEFFRTYTATGGGNVEVTVTPRRQPDGTEI